MTEQEQIEEREEEQPKVPSRVLANKVTKVRLTILQSDFVRELVRDNKPNLWNWRKYAKSIAVGVGYSPQAIDNLYTLDNVWFAARSLVNNLPVEIEVLSEMNRTQGGVVGDPDRDRKPGEPLASFRMERFCQELVADPAMRIYAAGRRAGYNGAGDYGSKLMSMPKIKARIKELTEERVERLKARQDEVLANLVVLSRINMCDYIQRFDGNSIQFEDSNQISRDNMYGIKKIRQTIRGVGQNSIETFSITLEDKMKANALLAQHLGLLDKDVTFDPREFAVQLRQLTKDVASKVPGGEI